MVKKFGDKTANCAHKDVLIILLILQAIIGIVLCFNFVHVNFETDNTSQFKGILFVLVSLMLVVGFPLLMAFPGKWGFSALFFCYLLIALIFEWDLICQLVKEAIVHSIEEEEGDFHFNIGSIQGLESMFAIACILISFGVVEGRFSFAQYVVTALIETVVYTISCFFAAFLVPHWFGGKREFLDYGGSVLVHACGGIFGVFLSIGQRKRSGRAKPEEAAREDPIADAKSASTYISDQLSATGSLILWSLWPAFAAALVDAEQFGYNAVATLAAISASTVTTFGLSPLLRSKHIHLRMEAADLANSSLAGGVSVGALLGLDLPFGVLVLTGMAAGALSTFGYVHILPHVQKKNPSVRDVCGVFNLHMMPGILGGVLNILLIAFGATTKVIGGLAEWESNQALLQLVSMLVVMFISALGGLGTGALVAKMDPLDAAENFEDQITFEVPADYPTEGGDEPAADVATV
eukprot:gnl/Dysnectes_brevis/493_a546_5688.p1 GENE.gnl/Dysnectes_brevis/493_a546_5688~~gnl/Dysnectes_brevis/493_a546_5688.p1  ORF type:complete len:465 (-),score=179.11 gnl/Dysnectes_brevis/493_a546_5688:62-1456(-)